ncbi:reverse transcriptase family protein [Sciscionella marina]|uniref:reverse transcriptase family protein n=1 Tax=Sciscionella marina TaxID=508770 RepID=UPI000371FAE2|nr:reverse transcriptase family protein [Sciscionella marina]
MRSELASAFAGAFLSGEWTESGLWGSGARVLGRDAVWLPALVREVLGLYACAPHDRPRELAAVIAMQEAAQGRDAEHAVPCRWPVSPTRMLRNPWHLPVLHSLEDLAGLLGLTTAELAWFSDPKRLARTAADPRLRHYRVTTRRAPSGAIRVLEAPKYQLKALQRRLLADLLGAIPPHAAAHGFRAGRSVATFAGPHAGKALVLRCDLEGFFASVTVGRVYGLFRTAGYPEPVAHALAGLTTTVLPASVWRKVPRPADPGLLDAHWRLGRRLAQAHLPQGAPTSPMLANLVAHRLDARCAGLAEAWGWNYTRYADDLAFSCAGGRRAGAAALLRMVERIVGEEGFRLNARKTAVQGSSARQSLGGLVVNEHVRVPRVELDRLRAILHNCARYGPSTQNRSGHADFAAHLSGRIAWVANHDPVRGARLRAGFEALDWSR